MFEKRKTFVPVWTDYNLNIAKYNYLVVPFRMGHLMNQRRI